MNEHGVGPGHRPVSSDTSELRDRVTLVTGAAGGLGRAICAEFEARGATVFAVDLQSDGCFHADVATAEGNCAMIRAALGAHGRLDVLVLNAGVQFIAPLATFPEREWRRLIDVMLSGPFLGMQAAWPHLIARPAGRILVTASTSSFVAERQKSAYVAAKHGVLGLVKAAALEGAGHGLTVNAVAPSWMSTPMVLDQVRARAVAAGHSEQEVTEELLSGQAVRRFVEPVEVARTLAFLASEHASAITGVCVPVDLGALA